MTSTPARASRRSSVDDVLDILSDAGDHDLAEIVQLVGRLCGGDAAGITIRRGDEYHVPVTFGIDPFVCAAEETFCRLTMGTEGLFTVEDARTDPRFADIGFVNGELARARFYASAPIHRPDGRMVGRLCVIGEEPRRLTPVQLRALATLGQSISEMIELRLLRAASDVPRPTSRQDMATLLSQLSAELDHDLKVPLTGIVASVEMLRDRLAGDVDPMVVALLQRCASSANRMTRMLDQHLATATAGGRSKAKPCDLMGVAQMVADDAAGLMEAMRAEVVVDELPALPADPDEMYSVFQNLLTNALKFARPGVPARVRITPRRVPEGWRIAVLDNGVGIPPDRRTDVFSLFSRAHSDIDGHGIGLATVARIVTAHGGRVGAEEAPGGGAEIWFTLPAA